MSIILQALRKVEHQHALERGSLVPDVYTSVGMESRFNWKMGTLAVVVSAAMLSLGLVIGRQANPVVQEITDIETTVAAANTQGLESISKIVRDRPAGNSENSEVVEDGLVTEDKYVSTQTVVVETEEPVVQPAVYFSQLPPELKQDMADLKVDVHYYQNEPEQRFVMINQLRYTEGEQLGDGLLLIEIVKEGVVMEYMNRRFILSRI
ncbi:MAG: general secretion pathway protein GspB [Sedimenticola sp.]